MQILPCSFLMASLVDFNFVGNWTVNWDSKLLHLCKRTHDINKIKLLSLFSIIFPSPGMKSDCKNVEGRSELDTIVPSSLGVKRISIHAIVTLQRQTIRKIKIRSTVGFIQILHDLWEKFPTPLMNISIRGKINLCSQISHSKSVTRDKKWHRNEISNSRMFVVKNSYFDM